MTDTREEFINAIRAQAFTDPDGRRIIHRLGLFTGADIDEADTIADVERADDVKWIDSGIGHDLAVLVDGRIWRYGVRRPVVEPRPVTNCPDCGVPPGQRHIEGCDVARCTVCGVQQLQCDGAEHDHDGTPSMEMWTGIWPGVVECREFGWWGHWTKTLPGFDHPITGKFIPCEPDHPDATEDLNRLAFAAALGWVRWDREQQRFVKS